MKLVKSSKVIGGVLGTCLNSNDGKMKIFKHELIEI